ncbi:MAG TPA: hypothetical protein VIK72_07205 [Clostridiaceae bacterium]
MESEKLFELMGKLYSELLGFKKETSQKLSILGKGQEDANIRLTKVEANTEQVNDKLKQLAEIQQNHFDQNMRNHQEIIEMLSDRVSIVEKVVKNNNIKLIK